MFFDSLSKHIMDYLKEKDKPNKPIMTFFDFKKTKSHVELEAAEKEREKLQARKKEKDKKISSLLFNITYEFTKFIENIRYDKKLKELKAVEKGKFDK